MPKFSKYDRIGCPLNHLKMYCEELGVLSYENEKLYLQLFQKSLTGPTLQWFVDDFSKFMTWDDLIALFVRHYNFNNEVAPDRLEWQRTG